MDDVQVQVVDAELREGVVERIFDVLGCMEVVRELDQRAYSRSLEDNRVETPGTHLGREPDILPRDTALPQSLSDFLLVLDK